MKVKIYYEIYFDNKMQQSQQNLQAQQTLPEQITRGAVTKLTRYSNVTTGYEWSILTSPGLTLAHVEYTPSTEAQSGAVGGGGTQTWTIRAIGTGRQYILLWYHRPWEKDTLEGAEILHTDIVEPPANTQQTPYPSYSSYQSPVPTSYQYPSYQYSTNPYYYNNNTQQTPATNPYYQNPYYPNTNNLYYNNQQTPATNPYYSQQQTPATNQYGSH